LRNKNNILIHEPKTVFSKYMAYNFIPKHANKVNGLVYLGAAMLIIVVGLRGLGSLAGKLTVIPQFLIGPDNKINPEWVLTALLIEFTMLFLLGFVTFFTPNEPISKLSAEKIDFGISNIKEDLRDLKDFADEEIKIVENYLEKFEKLSQKVSQIQAVNFSAIKKMKDTIDN